MKCFLVFLTLSIAGSFADDLQNDLEVIYERRLQELLSDNYNPPLAAQWRNQITKDGTWNDVDYTSGCPARDFTEPDCINAGGQDRHNCPCGTPGMWNTNWYGQMILIPGLVGNACLIMRTRLTDSQIESCRTILDRAYARIDGDPNGSMGPMTGANMLDVSSRGINLAIIANDTAILYDAISRYFNECQYSPGTYDGVKVDGSFMQHDAQIYNGNYGADFMRTMMLMFYQTKNTSFYPPQSVQEVYLTVINGSEWFMYRKNKEDDPLSPLVSWQYSVMGRMISHRYSDWNGIRLNLDTLLSATETWENHEKFQEIVGRLNSGSNVNPGGLIGTRFFPVSDYMVHRGLNYVVTLKMFSTRTTNSECNNDQNPFGFHLSDGVIYTYKNGHEYTDIYGAWNWYLTPGSTVDYGVNPLACNRVQFKGKESFVGGVAQGHAGVAVMNYTNPMSGSLGWLKSYFFLPNTYVVQYIGDIRSTSPTSPIYTTLDQRQLSGPVYIDGVLMNGTRVNTIARKVWHDRVGYEFVQPVNLTVDTSEHQANWPAIGISLGNETHSIFVAYVVHDLGPGSENRFDYFAHIDIELETFNNEFSSVRLRLERNLTESVDETVVRGVAYGEPGESGRYISLAFVTAGEFLIQQSDIAAVATDAPILLQFQYVSNDQRWKLAVADPSHKLNSVQITVNLTSSSDPIVLNVDLPSGNWAGGAATVEF